jgi:hypothetical protein
MFKPTHLLGMLLSAILKYFYYFNYLLAILLWGIAYA